jgi:small subunit ribosomal protein S13
VAKKGNQKEKKQANAEDDDFQYIVRIANTDIDGNKKLIHGLSSIKGIGRHMSTFLIKKTGLDVNQKMGYLSEKQIETISNAIASIQDEAPSWMLNHQKEYETGKDVHIIGPQIDMRLRDEINIMKKIRSYKGIRHERGLTVRGQRTRTNSRKGLSLGVSRSRER